MDKLGGFIFKKAKAVIVVDIGEDLKLLDIDLAGGPKINALKIHPLPGKNKLEAVPGLIQDFIRENNIAHRNAILRPLLESLAIKRLALPAIPQQELSQSIRWQLKEEIPFDVADAVLDFTVIKEILKPDGAKALDIICALAKESEVREQVLLIKKAELECLRVAPLAAGYARIAMKYLAADKSRVVCLLHVDEKASFISFFKEKKLEFYRPLPVTVGDLKESLASTLVSDKGRVELSADEINEVLFSVGIAAEGPGYKDKLNNTQIISLLRPPLEKLAQESARSLSYYNSQFQGGAVSEIFITGSALKIPHIENFLSQELSLAVKKISLQDKIKVSSGINELDLMEAMGSFGLALDYEQGINLLPHEFRTEKFEKIQRFSLRWVAILISAALLLSYLFARIGVMSYKRRLDNAVLHLNTLAEVRSMKSQTDEFKKFVADIYSGQPQAADILKVISAVVPRELFLDTLHINFEDKGGSLGGVIESAKGDLNAILNKFAADLKASGYVRETSIDIVENPVSGVLKFTLNIKLI